MIKKNLFSSIAEQVPYTSFLHMAPPKHQVVQLSEMLKRRVEEKGETYETFALNSPRAVFFSVVLIEIGYIILKAQ